MTTEKREMEAKEKTAIQPESGEPLREGLWFKPAVDIYETDTAITLRCDMPGVTKEGLDIDLREDTLTITGSVNPLPENRRLLLHEYDLGGFTRQFRVGDAVDQTKISAALADGVLTVTLPKAARLQPRKISVAIS